MGGCSHIHHVATSLLGKNYGDSYFINSRINVKSPAFSVLMNKVTYKNMLFDISTKRGVIILVNDEKFTNTIQYMVISDCKNDVDLREDEFIKALKVDCDER